MKNNIKTISVFVFLFFISIEAHSQINNNSLFLIIDKQNNSVRIKNDTNFTISYKYENENKNWALRLGHYNIFEYKQNLFRYLLPEEMITEYTRRGSVHEVKAFFKKLDSLDSEQISRYFRLYYPPYFYEYLDGQKFLTQKRWNIFFVFKSDLSKKYVTCYEVSLTQMTMEEE